MNEQASKEVNEWIHKLSPGFTVDKSTKINTGRSNSYFLRVLTEHNTNSSPFLISGEHFFGLGFRFGLSVSRPVRHSSFSSEA